MSDSGEKNGNMLATISFALSFVGVVTSIFVIGFPISIIAVILARKALKVGNFGTYEDTDDRGHSTTFSYSFRAYMALILVV